MINPSSINVLDKTIELTKMYYSIGEVAKIFGVATSLLRYWETEFVQLKPKKDRNGKRQYSQVDIKTILKIYDLTKIQGHTLEGAKKVLSNKGQNPSKIIDQLIYKLENIRSKISEMKMDV